MSHQWHNMCESSRMDIIGDHFTLPEPKPPIFPIFSDFITLHLSSRSGHLTHIFLISWTFCSKCDMRHATRSTLRTRCFI